MNNKEPVYIKLFLDYLDALEQLSDAERGRLFTALLEYGRTGEAPRLNGNERFIFPMMRAQIDRDFAAWREKDESLHEDRVNAGRKGGQARASKGKQNEANQANASKGKHKTKTTDKDKDNGLLTTDDDKDNRLSPGVSATADGLSSSSSSPYDSDFGKVMSALLDFIPEAPQSALEKLKAYYETCGRDVCLRAIDVARGERKASWAFIEGILRNKSAAGIRSLADWDRSEEERRRNRNGEYAYGNDSASGYAGRGSGAAGGHVSQSGDVGEAGGSASADNRWGIKSAF